MTKDGAAANEPESAETDQQETKLSEVMGGTPLAEELSEQELKLVIKAGQEVTIPQGWSFIWENTPADAAYLLLQGRVAVWHNGERVAELGAGDIVGETALRSRRLRTATVSALEPLVMLRFSLEAFGKLLTKIPRFAEAVDANVARRMNTPDAD